MTFAPGGIGHLSDDIVEFLATRLETKVTSDGVILQAKVTPISQGKMRPENALPVASKIRALTASDIGMS